MSRPPNPHKNGNTSSPCSCPWASHGVYTTIAVYKVLSCPFVLSGGLVAAPWIALGKDCISTLQMRRLELRKAKKRAQGYSASNGRAGFKSKPPVFTSMFWTSSLSPQQGFWHLGPHNMGCLVVGCSSVDCRIFSSFPRLYLLDTSRTPTLITTTKNVS